jgi:hypothetical protein
LACRISTLTAVILDFIGFNLPGRYNCDVTIFVCIYALKSKLMSSRLGSAAYWLESPFHCWVIMHLCCLIGIFLFRNVTGISPYRSSWVRDSFDSLPSTVIWTNFFRCLAIYRRIAIWARHTLVIAFSSCAWLLNLGFSIYSMCYLTICF